jgi:hypothetical protein
MRPAAIVDPSRVRVNDDRDSRSEILWLDMRVGLLTAGDGVSLANWIDFRDDEFIDLGRCMANVLRSVDRGGKISGRECGVVRQPVKKIVFRAVFFHFGASGSAMTAYRPTLAFATAGCSAVRWRTGAEKLCR